MALAPGANPITREQVAQWIESFYANPPATKTLEEFIRQCVANLKLADPMIDTSADGRDEFDNETHIADLIVADLPSYSGYKG